MKERGSAQVMDTERERERGVEREERGGLVPRGYEQ